MEIKIEQTLAFSSLEQMRTDYLSLNGSLALFPKLSSCYHPFPIFTQKNQNKKNQSRKMQQNLKNTKNHQKSSRGAWQSKFIFKTVQHRASSPACCGYAD